VSVSQLTRWVYFPVVTKMTFVLCCQMTGSNEFKLNQTPDDGISSVKFSPNTSQFLLVSSWDTTVRLYDVPANSMRLKYQHSGAVLDCAFYVSVCEVCFSIVFYGLTVHKVREKLSVPEIKGIVLTWNGGVKEQCTSAYCFFSKPLSCPKSMFSVRDAGTHITYFWQKWQTGRQE